MYSAENKCVQSPVIPSQQRLSVTQTRSVCVTDNLSIALDDNPVIWLVFAVLLEPHYCAYIQNNCALDGIVNVSRSWELIGLHNLLLEEPTDAKTVLYLILICFSIWLLLNCVL